jgi:hypothetical protein
MKGSFILCERRAKMHQVLQKTAGEMSRLNRRAGLPGKWLVVVVLSETACQPEEEL